MEEKEALCHADKKLISSVMRGTKLPSIHIAATKEQATYLDSRFGGIYYLPKGEKIPVCPEGEEMQFIAQINFARIPPLKGVPRKGILQFFVDTNTERFQNKMEDETLKRELYTVRYYPQPEENLQQPEFESCQPEGHLDLPWLKGKMLFQYGLSTRAEIEQDTFDFFIKPEELAACGFDDVLLCWHNCF